jgi:hypothetical protein
MDAWGEWPHIHPTPVFANFPSAFATNLYVWPEKDHLRLFPQRSSGAQPTFEATASAISTDTAPPFDPNVGFGMPGGGLSLAQDPNGTGVLFASRPTDSAGTYGVLHAYDPINVGLVWGDDQGPQYRYAKFVTPGLANGRVYMPTFSNALLVYGQGVPSPAGVAAIQQNPTEITMVSVGADGALYVGWEPNYPAPWHLPVRVSDAGLFPPGANVALAWDKGVAYGKVEAFLVDNNGALNVATDAGGSGWTVPQPLSPAHVFPAGAPVSAGLQWPDANGNYMVDVVVVNNSGQLTVTWNPPGASWNGPAALPNFCNPSTGVNCFAPGAHLATGRQNGHVLDLFAVDNAGELTVSWLVDNVSGWRGPGPISSTGFAQQGAPAATGMQSASVLDVFVVNKNTGALSVNWLVKDGPGSGFPSWQPNPLSISNATFPPSASIATGMQGGPNQIDVFAVDANGTPWVAWLVGGQGAWSSGAMPSLGPMPAGAPVTSANTLPDQSVLYLLSSSGTGIRGESAVGLGGWGGVFRAF